MAAVAKYHSLLLVYYWVTIDETARNAGPWFVLSLLSLFSHSEFAQIAADSHSVSCWNLPEVSVSPLLQFAHNVASCNLSHLHFAHQSKRKLFLSLPSSLSLLSSPAHTLHVVSPSSSSSNFKLLCLFAVSADDSLDPRSMQSDWVTFKQRRFLPIASNEKLVRADKMTRVFKMDQSSSEKYFRRTTASTRRTNNGTSVISIYNSLILSVLLLTCPLLPTSTFGECLPFSVLLCNSHFLIAIRIRMARVWVCWLYQPVAVKMHSPVLDTPGPGGMKRLLLSSRMSKLGPVEYSSSPSFTSGHICSTLPLNELDGPVKTAYSSLRLSLLKLMSLSQARYEL